MTHGSTEAIPDCDLLVVERHTLWPYERQLDAFARTLARCRQRGVPVLYELDDNLLDLHHDAPWEIYPGAALRGVVSFLVRRGRRRDRLVDGARRAARAPAEPASSSCRTLSTRGSSRPAPESAANTARRSRSGTWGRSRTRRTSGWCSRPCARCSGATRAGCGSSSWAAPRRTAWRRSSRVCRSAVRDTGGDDPYPRFVPWMRQHLGLGRRDRAARGRRVHALQVGPQVPRLRGARDPGVFSDVRPYRETVRHRETGLLAANDEKAWADALEEIVSDAALRARTRHERPRRGARQPHAADERRALARRDRDDRPGVLRLEGLSGEHLDRDGLVPIRGEARHARRGGTRSRMLRQ